eukprot:TRINITY_DN15036_c0_g1_i1.p1 TRINITY_DN15036_c0_g1~~TRINITY_DN15036_c0_g1_i1.p1  ORF type:complete len:756 (+),score=213.95 TRINITY_DN15036_c0_g1_i1:314-2269(+)
METLVARIEGFSFQNIRQVAAYIFFFDQALIKPNLPSLVESTRAQRGGAVTPAHVAAAAPASAATSAPTSARGVVDDSHLEAGLGEDSLSKEEERLMKHLKLGGGATKVQSKPAAAPAPTPASAPAPAAPKTVTPSTWQPTQHDSPAPTDDRGLQTDAARREEERIAKMFGGMSGKTSTPSSAATSSAQSSATPVAVSAAPTHPVPVQPSTGSNFELELWREINQARSTPQQYAQHLRDMLPHFDGTRYNIPGTKTARETKEGASAVEKAISFLESHRALSELSLSPGLSHSCRDLVGKASQATNIGAVETDAESDQRLSKYGNFVGRLFQNVAVGNLSPRDIVISWIVDDGNATKQHRDCLFDAANTVVGISSGPHMRFARVTVVATAGSYREASAAAAQEGTVAAVQVIPPDAPEVEKETEVNVGPFEERKEAFHIDITNLGCPAKALKLRLEKQGIELVLRRKVTVGGQIREFAQRLALPFPFQPSQISASYSVGIGKLALELKKASGSAAPAAGASSGEVGRFRVAADSSKTNDKIAVQPAQTSDHFAFSCDSSKYDTDVVVSLDGRKLTFAAQYSFDTVVDGEEVVKTVKANSAFTLPFDATMAQIELVPNGTKGSTVKVFKVAPAGSSSGAGVIVDTDINILSKS